MGGSIFRNLVLLSSFHCLPNAKKQTWPLVGKSPFIVYKEIWSLSRYTGKGRSDRSMWRVTMGAPNKNKYVADKGTKGSPAQPLHSQKMATELEIRDSIAAVREALDRSGCKKPNKWVFFSNKNDRLLTIEGDLYFIVCVLLEGDFTVSNYSFTTRDGGRNPSVFVTRSTGILEEYCCESDGDSGRRRGGSKPASVSEQAVRTTVITERDLAPRMAEFANWLMLSGAMTRARSYPTAVEVDALLSSIKSKGSISFREALSLKGTDPALMLSCIAKGLSNGVLLTDTEQVTRN